ncbi:MAG: DUF3164 family protein [Sphingobacteriaceae bacterium]|nr:DUF3164 family protein [Sphingobacteriaceae bacterium]
MDINKLTAQERKALMAELEAEQANEKKRIADERKAYKDLVNEVVPPLVEKLQEMSLSMGRLKSLVYAEMERLVAMKNEVYKKDDGQYTHTFSTDDGLSITIGYRVNDGWDDTVNTGIAKVEEYIKSFGKDEESIALVSLVLRLLSKDAKGQLKASRVLQLKKLADDTGDAGFIDAISIIQDAYRPVRTKQFIAVKVGGKDLPLSITEVEM